MCAIYIYNTNKTKPEIGFDCIFVASGDIFSEAFDEMMACYPDSFIIVWSNGDCITYPPVRK